MIKIQTSIIDLRGLPSDRRYASVLNGMYGEHRRVLNMILHANLSYAFGGKTPIGVIVAVEIKEEI